MSGNKPSRVQPVLAIASRSTPDRKQTGSIIHCKQFYERVLRSFGIPLEVRDPWVSFDGRPIRAFPPESQSVPILRSHGYTAAPFGVAPFSAVLVDMDYIPCRPPSPFTRQHTSSPNCEGWNLEWTLGNPSY